MPFVLAATTASLGSLERAPRGWQSGVGTSRPEAPAAASEGEAIARKTCSTCHGFPPPDILPRSRWNLKVFGMLSLMMARIGAPKNREPIDVDFPMEKVLAYYEGAAPQELKASDPWPEAGAAPPLRFARYAIPVAGGPTTPGVANVRLMTFEAKKGMEVVAADMTNGLILRGSPARAASGLEIIARVANPCHSAEVDLDRDGIVDLVVANLGGTIPGDYKRGSVVWLRGKPDGGFETLTLASQLPRIADVEPLDVDGDRDLDLVVAAFGWREFGSVLVLVLENRTRDWTSPVFLPREVDARQGTIHVPVTDLDRDGRLDVVALISQHHETVVGFMNRGKKGFETKTVYQAPHPGWGSSGIQLVDLDKDGDLDVLMTNGDMLDEFLLKPYHGIQWLENRGGFPFAEHWLASLNGVHRAQAADLDADGDLDIVACTLVPGMAKYGKPLPSLVWLEQVAPGRFERRTLEMGGITRASTWATWMGMETRISSSGTSRWTDSPTAPGLTSGRMREGRGPRPDLSGPERSRSSREAVGPARMLPLRSRTPRDP
jgi:hypothetical protein